MDTVSKEKRREIMSKVGGKNTGPEIKVRKLLHSMGYRFRLQRKDLPGKPDIVLPKYKTIIFVHGCFWHGHDCKMGKNRPKSNSEYWENKINNNIDRDKKNISLLNNYGWNVLIVWECQIRNTEKLKNIILLFLGRKND